MKNSALLEKLLNKLEITKFRFNRSMATEIFVFLVLEQVELFKKDNSNQEFADETIRKEVEAVCNYFEEKKIDTAVAISSLTDYLKSDDSKNELTNEFFNDIMKAVSSICVDFGVEEMSLIRVIDCIFLTPTVAVVKYVLSKNNEENPVKTSDIASKISSYRKDSKPKTESDKRRPTLAEKLASKIDSYKSTTSNDDDEEEDLFEDEIEEEEEVLVKNTLDTTVTETKSIQNSLLDKVFGQDHAISAFVSAFFQSELECMLQDKRSRPRAIFLFAGPPGVGKTYLAENVAEALGRPFKRFDMSEYSDKEAHLTFCGMNSAYKGSKVGTVTDFVDKNPKCVLLFDEIEKAHQNVIHIFLQMLDAGRVRDNFTEDEVSFVDTIIIFTTNAGKQLYENPAMGNLSLVSKKNVLNALETDINPVTNAPFFPRAICSRFASGNIVMFNHLTAYNLVKIVNTEFKKQLSGFEKKANLKINVDPSVASAIMFSEGGKADARSIKGKSSNFMYQELFELFRLLDSGKTKYSVKDLEEVEVNVEIPQDPQIASLFEGKERPEVLFFCDSVIEEKIKGYNPQNFIPIFASNFEDAKELMYTHKFATLLVDVKCGVKDNTKTVLNVEDLESEGRDFLAYVNEYFNTPCYLIEENLGDISKEEELSFAQSGIRGVCAYAKETFVADVEAICEMTRQQEKILELARANKVLTFKTLQKITTNGKKATITLFDFKLGLAVDSEDKSSILSGVSKPNTRFTDVIGAKDAKDELNYFVSFLKDPVGYMKKGVKAPRGVLLYGPPGTGKTLLAKAMAGESDVTFISAEGNQFLKGIVGAGSQKVHELFNMARKYAPAVLFIDEVDAIAKNRRSEGGDTTGDVLTAFLTEMDGFSTKSDRPVFVLAATNYDIDQNSKRSLDPAILRRFDRKILVDLPNKEEREQFILKKIEKNKNINLSKEQIENIAMRATGMSLSDLDNVFEFALRNSIKSNDCFVTDKIIEDAFESYNSGEEKTCWSEKEVERTARHEAGHALVCWLNGETPSYLTIVSRGNHGGYMQHADSENKGIYTKDDLIARVRTALGGRAAEVVYYGERDGISTGASGDLYSATSTIERMICSYGMDDKIGLATINLDALHSSEYYSIVKARVNEIISKEFVITKALIEQNKEAIDKLVEVLLKKSSIKGSEIDQILGETIDRNNINFRITDEEN